MNQEFINELKEHSFERIKMEIHKDKYFVKESYIDRGYRVDGEIHCGIQENNYRFGSVDVHIDFEKLITNHHAGFGELFVPTEIENQGVGKVLMFSVIETIRAYKEYYSIEDTIEVSGWLSASDKQNDNWKKSVPFYEKIGRLNSVDCFFSIGDDEQHYTADEFLIKAMSDGCVHYLI